MGYYSFDLRSLLSPRTSIGFHKRLKITRGRNKSRDQRPRLGTKFRDQSYRVTICDFFLLFTIFNNKFCHYRCARIERDWPIVACYP